MNNSMTYSWILQLGSFIDIVFTINIQDMEPLTTNENENTYMFNNWDKQSEHLKEQFPLLTDYDLQLETGREHDLLCKLENRLCMSREEMVGVIKKSQQYIFPAP